MFFTRVQLYRSPYPRAEIFRRLSGDRFKISNTNFEAIEENELLSLQPESEIVDKSLVPITYVSVHENNNGVDVVVTSRIRQLDLGAAQLTLIFCGLLFVTSGVLLTVFRNDEAFIGIAVLALALTVLLVFIFKMNSGYFDYIRKLNKHIHNRIS